MLNLNELEGAALRKAIQKRIRVYETAERNLDLLAQLIEGEAVASSEEMFDDLEDLIEADKQATASRNVIDVTGESGPARNSFSERIITLDKKSAPSREHLVILTKFTAPDRDHIVKHHGYLKKAREYQDELNYMILRLKDSTDKEDKALLKTLIAHKKQMEEKKEKAQDVLEDLANRHVPTELDKASIALEEHVIDMVGDKVAETAGAQWFITTTDDSIDFSYYLTLHLPDQNAHELETHLVLTGRINETPNGFIMRVFLTSMNQFRLPGHYDLGTKIAFTSQITMANAIKREANRLLSTLGVVAALSKNKLHTTTRQLREAGITKLKHVIDLRVQDNALYLLLANVNDRDIERDTVPDLIVLLKNILHKQKKDAVFMRSIQKTKSGKKMMKVISINEV